MVQQVLKTKRGKWAAVLVVLAVVCVVASLAGGSADAIPGAVILLVVAAVLSASALKQVKNQPVPTEQHNTEPETKEPSVSTKLSSHNVESFLAKGEQISVLDLGWGENPSGGYVNWSVYEVHGTNEKTNRKNKRQYSAKDEAEAIEAAKADGLIEPFDIRVIPNDPPTERQIDYLLSWNTTVPAGATKYDVSAILSRLENSYDIVSEKKVSEDKEVWYVRPLPGPSVEFAKYADSVGVKFSRFVGADELFCMVLNSLDDRERAAFFAYCVLCSYHRLDIENLQATPYAHRLYEFADIAVQDAALFKSIVGRDANDHKAPHKGSKAYKAVAEFFNLK